MELARYRHYVAGPLHATLYLEWAAKKLASRLYNPAMGTQHPLAVCTACGNFAWGESQINRQCAKQYGKKRCRGIYESSVHYTFKDCPTCKGEGRKDGEMCLHCSGQRMVAEKYKPGSIKA
jgi:hypothetical protein